MHAQVLHRAVAHRGACAAQHNGVLDSVLVLGSMVRMGLTKNGSRSPSEATPTARTARAPSETAPTPPTAAQAFQERELVFVPRSCQVTRRCRHLFCIAYPTVVFAIFPLPERPRNALTSTLTLSRSFCEHLNGGWFRNRIALLVICALCLSVLFSLSAMKALLFSLPSFSVLCCGQPSRVFRYIC